MTTGADIAESLPGGERTGEGSGTVPRIVVRGGEQPMAPAEAATQTSVGETPTKPGAVASTAPARPLPTAVRALGPAGAVGTGPVLADETLAGPVLPGQSPVEPGPAGAAALVTKDGSPGARGGTAADTLAAQEAPGVGTSAVAAPGPGTHGGVGLRKEGVVASVRALRFAALGDSLTAGIGDPVDGGWRGWAALLGGALGPARPAGAEGESGVRFHNFAVSGALTRDVDEQQVPAVLDFGPDIASVVVGVNDTLRCAFDIQDIAQRLDRVCAALAARGAVLLTTCLPDPGTMLGLPLPLARPLARRQRALNAVVHALAARYDTVHLHMADAAWVNDRSLWSADRLHPGERGHRMIAARFHAPLAARGLAIGPPPSLTADQPSPSRAAVMRWLATKGAAWVARRCQDLLPELLRLAGDELRHWARGTSARLDVHAEQALSRALATLSPGAPRARMGE